MGEPIKLNIGAGDTVIEGFTPIDRKFGTEAFPLKYDTGSVDEIRASHILEHFSYRDAEEALREWFRVLRPGGRIRIAVPDWDKLKQCSLRNNSERFMLMGGQIDKDDYHHSMYDWGLLTGYLEQVGFTACNKWESQNTDCAGLPISLNVEAIKPECKLEEGRKFPKTAACLSVPRVGWNDTWGSVIDGLIPFGISVRRFTGAFWGQCMQRLFNECVSDGTEWILTIDYDSVFTPKHIDTMIHTMLRYPKIDALCALQMRRQNDYPLITAGGKDKLEITNEPIQLTTAHFGLTFLRVSALKEVKKPWFFAKPDEGGDWGDGRLDDDIWFWQQWRESGKTIFLDTNARIGHLQLMVSEFDEMMAPRHVHVTDWREREAPQTAGKA